MASPESEALRANMASGIRRVQGDAGSTEMQSIHQMIEADRYLCAAEAAKSRRLGIRMMKIRPGDALGDS